MHLYKVEYFPVPINASSVDGTQILNLPAYLLITNDQQFYLQLDAIDLTECVGSSLKYCYKNFALSPVTSSLCILAIFANDNNQAINTCYFRYVQNAIIPTANPNIFKTL